VSCFKIICPPFSNQKFLYSGCANAVQLNQAPAVQVSGERQNEALLSARGGFQSACKTCCIVLPLFRVEAQLYLKLVSLNLINLTL